MKYIIYGTGIFSEVLLDEITMDNGEVLAFTLDDDLIETETHLNRPLIPFSVITSTSTVGFPLESIICRACIFFIKLMNLIYYFKYTKKQLLLIL